MIIDFLNDGKSVYIEGTDVAENLQGTPLFDYFGTSFDGSGAFFNVQNMHSPTGIFTDPILLDYQYSSESDYGVDELSGTNGAVCLVSQDDIGRVTYWDGPAGDYRVIMSSILFGSLIDGTGDNNKATLMGRYYSFLKIPPYSVDPQYDPDKVVLMGNEPNPFSIATQISFSIPANQLQESSLIIYDIRGRKIREFNELSNNGSLLWDGKDEYGRKVSSGVYLYRLQTDTSSEVKRMIMIR